MTRTTSLEMSKLLREAGIKQDAFFFHYVNKEDDSTVLTVENDIFYPERFWDKYAAFTTDELLEELPVNIVRRKLDMSFRIFPRISPLTNYKYWTIIYDGCRINSPIKITGPDLPEALAQMWLLLHSQGLLNK